jgi:hypothetical protein
MSSIIKAIHDIKEDANLIKFNERESCYEWYDEINQQLTVYNVKIGDHDIVVNIYQSPILQGTPKKAKDNVLWRTKCTYGKEYMKMIAEELNRVSR